MTMEKKGRRGCRPFGHDGALVRFLRIRLGGCHGMHGPVLPQQPPLVDRRSDSTRPVITRADLEGINLKRLWA